MTGQGESSQTAFLAVTGQDRTRVHRRIPPTPLEVLQLTPPPLEVLRWNHDRVRVCCWAPPPCKGLRRAPPLGEALRQMPSPEAVLWWCMWPKCNIVQSPPWEAFRTGVTVRGQEGQSEWISGDQLCVQTPAVCPSSWISTSELEGLTLNPWM